jgi:hypothetical protein
VLGRKQRSEDKERRRKGFLISLFHYRLIRHHKMMKLKVMMFT